MSNYTKGPWKVKGATVWSIKGPVAIIPGPSTPMMDGSHIEPDANRRLIVEAPEMFRQIFELTEYLEREDKTDCDAYRDAMNLIYRVYGEEEKIDPTTNL